MSRFTFIRCKSGRDAMGPGAIRILGCARCGEPLLLDPATHKEWTANPAALLVCPPCDGVLAQDAAAVEELLARHRIRFARGRPRSRHRSLSDHTRQIMQAAAAALRSRDSAPELEAEIACELEAELDYDLEAKARRARR